MDFLMADTLPWLAYNRSRMRTALLGARPPHSLLVSSAPGLGAEYFANWIAALALCESAAARPCAVCASCALLKADTHPDYHVVRLEEDASQIKVDQIRELTQMLSLRSYRGGYRVAVIEDAETLNASSANAFLKTLEEPGDRSLLILLVRPTHRLPATIASRCVRVKLSPPEHTVAIEWLNGQPGFAGMRWDVPLMLAAGAPLRAMEVPPAAVAELEQDMPESLRQLADGSVDVTLLAERWIRSFHSMRLAWLENWITRRVHSSLAAAQSPQSAGPARLPAALLKPKMRSLFELLDATRELRLLASTSMNQQLALEALLVSGQAALAK